MEAKLRSGCLDDVLVKKISVYNDSRIAIIDELQSLNDRRVRNINYD